MGMDIAFIVSYVASLNDMGTYMIFFAILVD